MDVERELARLEAERKPWLWGGTLVSALYVALVVCYVGTKGLAEIWRLEPNAFGDLLAGTSAPLAFFWLFVGTRLQAIELKQNSKSLTQQAAEMRSAVEQASLQAKAAAESADIAKQREIRDVIIFYETKLGSHAAIALNTYMSAGNNMETYWARFNGGDRKVFVQEILHKIGSDYYSSRDMFRKWFEIHLAQQMRPDTFFSEYTITFDNFMKNLALFDDMDLVYSYKNGAFGRLHDLLNSLLTEHVV